MTNIEFYNVDWLREGSLFKRRAIIDEVILGSKGKNEQEKLYKNRFEKAFSIYNELKKILNLIFHLMKPQISLLEVWK